MPGALILINGFPGVGKHAVARELTSLLPECKFFDTRSLLQAASQLYASNDPAHGLLRKNLKHAVFDTIAKVDTATRPRPTYVLTDFLSVAARQTDREIMAEFVAFARASGFAFIHVILGCSTDENVRRLGCRHAEVPSASGGDGGASAMDADVLLQVRMEEEIGQMAPLAGLSGEFELDTTRMDARTTAGVLAEYCLDALRGEGWWIQLNGVGRGGVPRPSISITLDERSERQCESTDTVKPARGTYTAKPARDTDTAKPDRDTPKPEDTAKPPSPRAKRSTAAKLGLSLGIKKKSFSAR